MERYTMTAKIENFRNGRVTTIVRTYRNLTQEQVNNARGVVRMLTPFGSTNTFTVVPA